MEEQAAWLYRDLGRKILGPNSLAFLTRSIRGFASAARDFVEKPLGGKPSRKLSDRLDLREMQVDQFSEIFEAFWLSNQHDLMNLGFTLPQNLDGDSVSLGQLPWANQTWELFSSLSLSKESPISVLEGLNWSDAYSESHEALAFFDIVQTVSDWLPYAHSKGLLVNLNAGLEEAAAQFQMEICVRAGLSTDDIGRYSDLLARRNGWGIGSETLDQISEEYALSRERIRQIEARLLATASSRSRMAWQVYEQISHTELPDKLGDVDQQIRSLNGLSPDWSINSIRSLMEISGSQMHADLLFANTWPSTEESEDQSQKLNALRKARSDVGVIKLSNVHVPSLNCTLTLEEAAALTRAKFGSANIYGEYAIVSNAANTAGIYSAVALQLGICNPLHVDQVINGVRRAATQRNSQNTLPDREAFIALLRQTEDFAVSDSLMVSGREQEYEPGTIQRWLVDLISSQDGFVISKAQAFRFALSSNIKLSSLNNYVTYQAAIRTPQDGFLTLVGHAPSNVDIDFAKRVADALYVPNSTVEFASAGVGALLVEFIFSTPFFTSGTLSSSPLLTELLGSNPRRVLCCEEFNETSNSNIKVTSGFLTGLAAAKDHLIYAHGFTEGDNVRLRIDETYCQVLVDLKGKA